MDLKARLEGSLVRRKSNGRAGRQIRRRSWRRKLTSGAEGEADRLKEGASRSAARKQNRKSSGGES
jgi:hypothetical protein